MLIYIFVSVIKHVFMVKVAIVIARVNGVKKIALSNINDKNL
jgi:hypothetical protein